MPVFVLLPALHVVYERVTDAKETFLEEPWNPYEAVPMIVKQEVESARRQAGL